MSKNKVLFVVLSFVLSVFCLSACTNTERDNGVAKTVLAKEQIEEGNTKMSIVTTIFPVYDWTKNVTGDKADVICLINNGTDLHNYQPSAEDIVIIQSSDLFVYVGGESDEWVGDIFKDMSVDKRPQILNLMDILSRSNLLYEEESGLGDSEDDEEEETEYDEHIWLSLRNARYCVEEISNECGLIDKSNDSFFNNNARKYIEELDAIDEDMRIAPKIAKETTYLFADRFPFIYFMKDYGFNYVAAFKGCSAESEASFEIVTKLAQIVDEKDLDVVYVLDSSDGKIADTVIQTADKDDVEKKIVNSMQSVTQADIDAGVSYLDIMRSNVSAFKEGLQWTE